MAQEIALVTNPMRVPLVMSRIGWLVLAMDIRVWRRNGGAASILKKVKTNNDWDYPSPNARSQCEVRQDYSYSALQYFGMYAIFTIG